jgi:hypothetical protein
MGLPVTISRFASVNGKRTNWKQIAPADPAGVDSNQGIAITPDAKSFVYSYRRRLSDLYLVEGLKQPRGNSPEKLLACNSRMGPRLFSRKAQGGQDGRGSRYTYN